MKLQLCIAALAAAASFSVGCANILGTSEYRQCSDDDGGGGDGSGDDVCDDGSSTSAGSTSSNSHSGSSTSGDCHDLTVVVSGSVKVKLSTIDADFEDEFSGPICAPAGTLTMFAECDQDGGDDPPVSVTWGNELCDDDTTSCTFDLDEAETFTVTGATCQ